MTFLLFATFLISSLAHGEQTWRERLEAKSRRTSDVWMATAEEHRKEFDKFENLTANNGKVLDQISRRVCEPQRPSKDVLVDVVHMTYTDGNKESFLFYKSEGSRAGMDMKFTSIRLEDENPKPVVHRFTWSFSKGWHFERRPDIVGRGHFATVSAFKIEQAKYKTCLPREPGAAPLDEPLIGATTH